MCCNWMVGSKVMSSGGSNNNNYAPLTEHMKLKIRRDLGRWSRKLLLCLGLENIGKHIVGDAKWEKLYDGSTGDQDETGPPEDFEPEKTPPERNRTPPGRNRKGTTPTRSVVQSTEIDDDEEEDDDDEDIINEGKNEEGAILHSNSKSSMSPASGGNNADIKGEEDKNEENGEVDMITDEPVHGTEDDNKILMVDAEKSREAQREDEEMEEGEVHERNVEDNNSGESAVDHEVDHHSCSSPNSQVGGGVGGDEEFMGNSPAPSETATGDEKEAGGGALVDNLFQILPYWYFLNKAFGLGGGDGEEGNNNPMFPTSEGVDEDEDEHGSLEGGGRRSSSPVNHSHRPNSNSNPRLNSILLLESLRQQLQGQGGQIAPPNENTLQQGIQLQDIISRMSGGGGQGISGGNNSSSSNIPWRGNIPSQGLDSHHASSSSNVADLDMDDQPLDLTSSSQTNVRREEPATNKISNFSRRVGEYSGGVGRMDSGILQPSPFLLDEQTSKVFRSNPRSSKGYTAQELQAALHDIQSGKLGTRRAAVIYGIPRSTLRNKVYKLGKDRGRLFSSQQQNGPGLHNNNNNNSSINNNNNNIQGKDNMASGSGSGSLLGKLSYLQGLNASNYLSIHHNRAASAAAGGGTRVSAGVDEGCDGEVGSNYLKHLRKPPTLYPVNNGNSSNINDGKSSSPPKLHPKSSLSELISKHAQQQRGSQQQLHQHHYGGMGMDVDDPYGSGDNEPNPPTSLLNQTDWKSAISRHEQLLSHHHNHQRDDIQQATSSISNHHRHQQQQQHLHHLQQQQQGDDGSNSMDLAGKKSRPKRGKYRNYDREALIKAVRAVQNGEMSVHRAGSFFGVPHSTLEYKVKERHLLRRPKRKEVTSPISQTKSSSPESSSDAAPSSVQARPGGFNPQSSFYSKGQSKNLSVNNNNSSGGGTSSGLPGSSYLFPLTSDLRESLSRYLNAEQQQDSRGGGSDTHSEMEVGGGSGQGRNDNDDDGELMVRRSSSRKGAGVSTAEEEREPASGPFALEGLIGSRLSSLFQLNDMLIRSSGGEGNGGGVGERESRESLLDLSKK